MRIEIEDMDGDGNEMLVDKVSRNRFHFTVGGDTVACDKADAIRIVELITGDSQDKAEEPPKAELTYESRVALAMQIYRDKDGLPVEDAVKNARIILEGMR